MAIFAEVTENDLRQAPAW